MNAREMANYTKVKVRELQRTLYLAAKANPKRRFHALYDKVYREDVMTLAWKRVKANGGSAGVDQISIDYVVEEYGEERFIGETIRELKEGTYRPQPVRRKEIEKGNGKMRLLGIPTVKDRLVQMAMKIVIEPLFEADFKNCSYGFRPKRDLHQALAHIRRAVNDGKVYWVVDVDITAFFDNIPHEKLMKLVALRISDRRTLKMIRKWLEAGVMKEGERYESILGTPQGGVISPLLANIYANYLDTIWEKQYAGWGTLVRYADDLVVLCEKKQQAMEAIQVLKAIFKRLELEMNTDKSKLVNLWGSSPEEGFDFLGYHHRRMEVWRKGGTKARILRSFPSKKALKKMRTKVKELTAPRYLLGRELTDMVKSLNPVIAGWRNAYGKTDPKKSAQYLKKIDWYIRKRLTLFWNKKHKRRKTWHFKFHETLTRIGLQSLVT